METIIDFWNHLSKSIDILSIDQMMPMMIIIVLYLVLLWFISFSRTIKMTKIVVSSILLSYVLYILFSAVIIRPSGINFGLELDPLWDYKQILEGKYFWPEVINNILLGIPLGSMVILLLSDKFKPCVQCLIAVSFGFLFSVCIEISQYTLHKGLADLGDVLNNTLGSFLGALLSITAVAFYRKMRDWINEKSTPTG